MFIFQDQQMNAILEDAGFDPYIWLKHFKDIGVSTPTALKLCGEESFSSLKDFAETPYLEKRLLIFLRKNDNKSKKDLSQNVKMETSLKPAEAIKTSKDALDRQPGYNIQQLTTFDSFLEKLNLKKFFPQTLTLQDALTINERMLDDSYHTFNAHQLLFLILEKINMSNLNGRNVLLKKKKTNSKVCKQRKDDIADGDYGGSNQEEEEQEILIHPLDSLLTLLHCCDNFLRQDLYQKLNSAQLAVPLLLRNPHTGEVEFPLWSMRSIVRRWRCQESEATCDSHDGRIVDCEVPLISFMRFSHPESYSKSFILNKVMSCVGQSVHHFFFNQECEGSSVKRKFADGTVEACWYLPSGEKSDVYNDVITFANLRGNVSDYECEKQFAFLSVESYMSFIFLSEQDITKSSECLKKLNSARGKVLFLMNNCSKYEEGELKRLVPKCDIINLYNLREPAAIVRKIQTLITSRLSKTTSRSPFCMLSNSGLTKCLELNIKVDELIQECHNGKEFAQTIMSHINNIPTASKVKEKVVPLQGPNLWHKWARLDKQQKRMKVEEMEEMKLETFVSQKTIEKERIRHRQLEQMKKVNLSTVMTIFIHVLSTQLPEVRAYFLQWLKFYLDDRSSKILPNLQEKCSIAREKLQNKKITDKSELKRIRNELEQHDQELINASFGVEHIFRELGQMYECAMDLQKYAGPDLVKEVQRLCEVAAHLLLSGFPLEIIDGDAAHVPLKWVTGILDHVKKSSKISKQAKLAVLSVLGIQSTGKSTLLNTLFGIRFAVSAGRCTRGAYCQLLPVKSIRAKCDYMLVIDTEGLRAPELDYQQTAQHDNELATLVIGLAGATIINISGEVVADVNDILQTSVHAFIRMKSVKLKPSCHFVRHHVIDVAANKTNEGIQRFQQTLDEITVSAAKTENLSGKYKFFSDVIAFDNKKDVQNFPNLWLGNPPMTPVNPAYCEAALKLKSKFIRLADESPDYICSINDFNTRLSKLWDAVLQENFLFNLKNALEAEAFANLDAEYGKWSWRLQLLMLKWEGETRKSITPNSSTRVEYIENEQIQKIIKDLDNEYDAISVDFKQFFENAPTSLSQIMAQWRTRYEHKLKNLKQDHKKGATRFCHNLIEKHLAKAKLEEMKKGERDRISEHLKKIVAKMNIEKRKGKKLSDSEIKYIQSIFDKEWDKWMKDLEKRHPIILESNFSFLIQNCIRLNCQLGAYDALICSELKNRPLVDRGNRLQVVLDQNRHLNFGVIEKMKQKTPGFLNTFTNFFSSPPIAAAINTAKQMTRELLSLVQNHLSQDDISYDDNHIVNIVRLLMQKIKEFDEDKQQDFNFTTEYRVDIILEAAGYALRRFTQLQYEYKQNHPVTYLATLKSSFNTKFSALCNATVQEQALATCLIDLVLNQINSALKERLSILLANDVRSNNSIFTSKLVLKGQVLLKLLSKEDFNLYSVYLTDISKSYLYWIKQYVEEHCKMDSGGEWRIVQLANQELSKIMANVTMAAQKANESTSKVKDWLTIFHTHLRGVILIDEQELHSMIDLKEDNNLKFFTEEFLKGIEQCKQYYLRSFKTPERSTELNLTCLINETAVIVRDNIAGCCEQCPFCKEQCERTDSEHKDLGDHFCSLHRPQCLGGYRIEETQEMVLSICTEDVASDRKFKCGATDDAWIEYKKYRDIYPDWDIVSEERVIAPYWKWFIAKYKEDIVTLFKYKQVPLDEDWTGLRAKDAESDVKKRYNLT